MHIAAVEVLAQRLLPAVEALRGTLTAKARAFDDVIMIGRTHCRMRRRSRSARSSRLGRANRRRHRAVRQRARRADGAGARSDGRRHRAERASALRRARRGASGDADRPAFRAAAQSRRRACRRTKRWRRRARRCGLLAGALMKMANDVRSTRRSARRHRRAADPGERARVVDHAGQGEPDPGRGAHDGVRCRCTGTTPRWRWRLRRAFPAERLQAGHPAQRAGIGELLADACRSFDAHCARGLEPDRARIAQHVQESLMLVTALCAAHRLRARCRRSRATPTSTARRSATPRRRWA